MLDLLNNVNADEISEELKSKPIVRKYFVRKTNIGQHQLPIGDDGSHGANYIWVNNRIDS